MSKIALISSPGWATSRVVPHALMELSAYLECRGMAVDLIDVKRSPYGGLSRAVIENVMAEIIAKVRKRKYEIVGLSCFTMDYWVLRELACRIKEAAGSFIVVGGIHPTLMPEDFFYNGTPFDAVAIGEGEETLYELASAGRAGDGLEEIRGVAFLKNGAMKKTAPRQFMKDISGLPRPSYEKLDMEYYLESQRDIIRSLVVSGVHILTGRGCPCSCTFCANRIIY